MNGIAQVTIVLSALGAGGENLLDNGGFEKGLAGWHDVWARKNGAAAAAVVSDDSAEGTRSVRIEHTGREDWSLGHGTRVAVKPGDIFELTARVRAAGEGRVTLCVVTIGAEKKTADWSFGAASASRTDGWRTLRSRFVVPPGIATVWPRLIGRGPATIHADAVTLVRAGTLDDLRAADLPATVTAENEHLAVTFHTADPAFAFTDRRAKQTWQQRPRGGPIIALGAQKTAGGLDLRLLDPSPMMEIAATVQLDTNAPECVLTLSAKGEMKNPIRFPPPLASRKEDFLIAPVNEGIAYPAADETLRPMRYHLYGGHGLCMPWYGATAGGDGWMAIVETADDAVVGIPRREGLLCLAPAWQPQKGRFGYPRKIRYCFFADGGYTAMAKRYRRYAQETGLFRTLAEKRKVNPHVDRLIGAVNVWCWDNDAVSLCREMQAAGITRILWSNRRPPEQLKALNDMGVLTSRYDIYQDAMNPKHFPRLRWKHGDWTSDAWKNDDIAVDAEGRWLRGWRVEAKDGEMIPCGVLCDSRAVDYARKRIPPELATHPYRCRFIDTTTASPWRECYHPDHPMTRTDSKRHRMRLLEYISKDCGLVCGSETGHDAAVPHVHYFEGMLSLGPYRVPDAGRRMQKTWDEVPERVATFQTGHYYRLPLWELVYHDCVVAQWYWGDYNNKLPALWDRRDLWNALYGTPPMFMFDRKKWHRLKNRFVRSYRTATPVARATGYREMLSHAWLTDDHAVQQTRFAGGITVTVNFGDEPFTLPGGRRIAARGYFVEGVDMDVK